MIGNVIHIPEIPVEGKPLGRHMDTRIAVMRETGGPPPLATTVISAAHRGWGLPLNQQRTASCTANMVCGALNSQPHYKSDLHPRTLNEQDAIALYVRETTNEGQPYPQNDPGGTGQYACEAAIELGMCSDFQVTAVLDEALRALVLRPIGVGVNWYDSMDSVDSSGAVTITPGAQVRGGHEIVALAIDAPRRRIGLSNSWGLGYGVAIPEVGVSGGCFWLGFDDFGRLLGEGGDVVVPRTARGWVAKRI